jgi:hypothetical protein
MSFYAVKASCPALLLKRDTTEPMTELQVECLHLNLSMDFFNRPFLAVNALTVMAAFTFYLTIKLKGTAIPSISQYSNYAKSPASRSSRAA